jgi:hypothetical protein
LPQLLVNHRQRCDKRAKGSFTEGRTQITVSRYSYCFSVGSDITVSGSSYQNLGGYVADLTIYGYGSSGSKVTVSSGTSNFVGAIDAPNYSTTISGSADYVGALISHDLAISGGSSFLSLRPGIEPGRQPKRRKLPICQLVRR